ncbi:MAG: electron transport complex subunit RsxB [Pseudomonadota bacterium]
MVGCCTWMARIERFAPASGTKTVVNAALAMLGLFGAAGIGLALLSQRSPRDTQTLVARIDAVLPQTQCAQCGYPGCAPYAEAIALGEADINRCPPGGPETIVVLAELLGAESIALAADVPATVPPQIALIDEAACVGCALCLPACPVDAIIGAPRLMHTVVSDECTGCELCLPPCPVDCIELRPLPSPERAW